MEYVQLQLNYFDWDSKSVQSGACYEVAAKHRKPVIVMEPVKGGALADVPQTDQKCFRRSAGSFRCLLGYPFCGQPRQKVMMVFPACRIWNSSKTTPPTWNISFRWMRRKMKSSRKYPHFDEQKGSCLHRTAGNACQAAPAIS